MSLRGDLRTMALPDVLQWVATGQKTGTLHVERRSIQKRIILREGNIFSSWSNDPRESLGQFLIRLRLVTEEQLFRALLAQEEKGRLLGSILVGDGLLGEDDLKRALKAKAEETVFDLFLWPSGQFEFREGEFPDDILITFESPVTPVILEGIRRVDEWQRIKAVFPSMETTVKVKGPPPPGADAGEKQLLGLAAAGKSLAEISLELRRSEFETASLIYEMHGRGVVVAGEVRSGSQGADPVGAIQALLTLAYQRLQEKRYDAALKAYEEVLALDRLNQNAKKGLIAAMEARQRERQLHTIPRDKVPALAVDFATLTKQNLDPQEGFVISRVNGQWDIQSILKLCPMDEDETLLIFSRLLDRKLIRARGLGKPQIDLPRTPVIWRSSVTSAPKASGVIDCGPSERARSGSWWTSTIRPSAPTAAAPRDIGDHLVAPAGAVRRVDQDRQVRDLLDRRHHGQVERVAREVRERAHAALAQDHLVVALGEDVLGRHQELLERRGEAALQQHRLLRAARALEQREVLHVAGADLDRVGVALDEVDAVGVDRLGDDGQPRLLAGARPGSAAPPRRGPGRSTGSCAA